MHGMNWSANVKIPFDGWFGANSFATKREARDWVAKMYRNTRRCDSRLSRPSYASRSYILRPYLLLDDNT